METYYIANRNLLIPNGPGTLPSSTRVSKDDVFSLDGTEPIDVALLLQQGAIKPTDAPRNRTEGQETASGSGVVVNPTPRRKPALKPKGGTKNG